MLFVYFELILNHVQARGYVLEAAGPDPHIGRVMGSNFAAGMVAGGIAAAATCPLDVVKTWRQIEVCYLVYLISHSLLFQDVLVISRFHDSITSRDFENIGESI